MQTICTTIALSHPMLLVKSLWKNNLIMVLESLILKHTEVDTDKVNSYKLPTKFYPRSKTLPLIIHILQLMLIQLSCLFS